MDLVGLVDQIDGPQSLLAQGIQFQPADTPGGGEKLLARLAAFGPFIDAHLDLLDEARATGMTAPRIVAERTIAQAERLLAMPVAESPVVVGARLADGDGRGRERVADAVRDVVNPALARYVAALRGPYLAATREEPASGRPRTARRATGWPSGRGRASTWTRPRPPDRPRELAAIDAERRTIARGQASRRWPTIGPASPPTHRTGPPRRKPSLPGPARTSSAQPPWPRAGSAAAGRRLRRPRRSTRSWSATRRRPSTTRRRWTASAPGIYFVQHPWLPTRLLTRLASTTYHEAVPGHHFQIALEMEHPTCRPSGASAAAWWARPMPRAGASTPSGWPTRWGSTDPTRSASPCSTAGLAGGAPHRRHRDPRPSQGSRLGVDLLRDEAGLPTTDAGIETDRYIVWPGQALTYKIGQREIERLRAELEARDGSAFDLARLP